MNLKWATALIFLLITIGNTSFAQQESAGDPVAEPAKFLKGPPLDYPALDRLFSHTGKVVLLLDVRADGTVSNAVLNESSGWQGLDDQALISVLSWQFTPAKTQSGKTVQSQKLLSVDFAIDSSVQEEWSSTDFAKNVKRALDSYYVYKSSSTALLDACAGKGFDTTAARKQLELAKTWPEEKTRTFVKYLNDVKQPWSPPKQLLADYQNHIKLGELSKDKSDAAKLRCRRVVVSFEIGYETFEHFDSEAYQTLGTVDF